MHWGRGGAVNTDEIVKIILSDIIVKLQQQCSPGQTGG